MARIPSFPAAIVNKYSCPGTPISIAYPYDSYLKTGFVELIFGYNEFENGGGTAKRITIGNKSYIEYIQGGRDSFLGKASTATRVLDRPFIKDFNYSFVDSCKIEATIVDVNGGKFRTFFESIPGKDCAVDPSPLTVLCNFGWIYVDQFGNKKVFDLSTSQTITILGDEQNPPVDPFSADRSTSYYLNFLIQKIDLETENGFWVYKLTMVDLTLGSQIGSKSKETFGTEQNKSNLQNAIDNTIKSTNCKIESGSKADNKPSFMFATAVRPPNVSGNSEGVAYNPALAQKVIKKFKFASSDGGGSEGPNSIYNTDGLTGMDAARTWCNSVVTEKGNGMFFMMDCRSRRPFLYIVEDTFNDNNKEGCATTQKSQCPLITYVVNGGNSSSVLSFSPKIELVPVNAMASPGPNANAANNNQPKDVKDGNKIPGKCNEKNDQKGFGVETFVAVPSANLNFRAPKIANDKEFEALWANSEASKITEVASPIEADLKIIGDPWYASPLSIVGTFISIIYLEPYAIGGYENLGCDYALTSSSVNPYFSRSNYYVSGIVHSINDKGQFETVLKVSSAIPESLSVGKK
jgi:hypothetical protein